MCDSQRALSKGGPNRVADVPSAPKAVAAAKPTNTAAAIQTPKAAVAGAVRSALAAPAPAPKASVAPIAPATPTVAKSSPTPSQAERAPVAPPATPEVIMDSTMKSVQAVLTRIDTAIAEKQSKATNMDYLRSAITNISSAILKKPPEILPNLAAHQRALANLIGPYLGNDEKKFRNVRRAAGLNS